MALEHGGEEYTVSQTAVVTLSIGYFELARLLSTLLEPYIQVLLTTTEVHRPGCCMANQCGIGSPSAYLAVREGL